MADVDKRRIDPSSGSNDTMLVGKTIAAGDIWHHLVGFRFTDGTWIYGRTEIGGFGDQAIVDWTATPDHEDLFDIGVIDRAEYGLRMARDRAFELARKREMLRVLTEEVGAEELIDGAETTEDVR